MHPSLYRGTCNRPIQRYVQPTGKGTCSTGSCGGVRNGHLHRRFRQSRRSDRYLRSYADLTFLLLAEVYDLFQLLCVLSSFFFPPEVIFHSRVVGACLSCDHGLHCSDELNVRTTTTTRLITTDRRVFNRHIRGRVHRHGGVCNRQSRVRV